MVVLSLLGLSLRTFEAISEEGESCTLSYRIMTPNGKVGHVVNVFGWYVYMDSNGKLRKYLVLADGWHSSIRYLLYDEIDFVNTYGVAYKIYK